ncbi:MAG TPA: hypothetical protein VFW98_01210 [Gemmatimonadaceae bacterium]|nr:hypothetical protein [Gemmatimonadaceae bacterium]
MDHVTQIVQAVLYEGYILWPYRRSAIKNRQRWTFGGIYPHRYITAEGGGDRWVTQAQCLLEGDDRARIDVCVRFLHVVRRQVMRCTGEVAEPVDELRVGDASHLSWEEATERHVAVPRVSMSSLVHRPVGHVHRSAECGMRRVPIAIPAGRTEESVLDAGGARVGALVRSWHALQGTLEMGVERIRPRLYRITIRTSNSTRWNGGTREEAAARAFASAHTVLRASGGAFVSLTNPPNEFRSAARGCRNDGVWPVLVGEPGDRHTMLAAPIILPDYPQIAPESPGDLFDGGEIDQLLILNILSMTDEEKREMRATDPRAREILDRCDSLTPQQLMRLHGTMREMRPVQLP